jgi:hypothetical protein
MKYSYQQLDRDQVARRICAPSGYGPSSAVGALANVAGRSRVRTPNMYHIYKKKRTICLYQLTESGGTLNTCIEI